MYEVAQNLGFFSNIEGQNLKNQKRLAVDVLIKEPIQWYHFHADLIWPDGVPFKQATVRNVTTGKLPILRENWRNYLLRGGGVCLLSFPLFKSLFPDQNSLHPSVTLCFP